MKKVIFALFLLALSTVLSFVAIKHLLTDAKNKEINSLKATIEQLQKWPELPVVIFVEDPVIFVEMPYYTLIFHPLTPEDIIKGEEPARFRQDFVNKHGDDQNITTGFLMYITHPPLYK